MPRRKRPTQEQLTGPNGHRSSRPEQPLTEADGFAAYLLAQLGRLDTRPETIEALQRGLDHAWAVLDEVIPE